MERLTILAISGSIRDRSSNQTILKEIAASAVENWQVEFFDALTELPYFNPDRDTDPLPTAVVDFRGKIEQADGVIICTPEYVFSLPGVLKNALEWTVSTLLFADKPVALITASASGEKAAAELQLIMQTVSAGLNESTTLLINGVRGKVTHDGVIDPAVSSQLNALIKSFDSQIRASKSARNGS